MKRLFSLIPNFFVMALFAFSLTINACELEQTEYGYRLVGDDCFQLLPKYRLKMPNLVVTGAGTTVRYGNGFSLGATVRNNGEADTDKTLLPQLPSIDGSGGPNDGSFNLSVQIHVLDLNGNFVMFFDHSSSRWVNFADWSTRLLPLQAGDFRSIIQPPFQTNPNPLYRFELPDIEKNYDVCIFAWVDPPSPQFPRTEIRESSESDNWYYGFTRLPGRHSVPNFSDSKCFRNW